MIQFYRLTVKIHFKPIVSLGLESFSYRRIRPHLLFLKLPTSADCYLDQLFFTKSHQISTWNMPVQLKYANVSDAIPFKTERMETQYAGFPAHPRTRYLETKSRPKLNASNLHLCVRVLFPEHSMVMIPRFEWCFQDE